MATPKVYVICDQNCKFEGMTKEQILTAIMQAVNEGTIGDIDAGFIQTIRTINGIPLNFFVGEQSAYDALTDSEKENLFAIITNDTTAVGIAEAIEDLQTNYEELFKGLSDGSIIVKKAREAPDMGIYPLVDESNNEGMAFVFKNTNGFGVSNDCNGYFKLWSLQGEDGKYYCALIPSLQNKLLLGSPERQYSKIFAKEIFQDGRKIGRQKIFSDHTVIQNNFSGSVTEYSPTITISGGVQGRYIVFEISALAESGSGAIYLLTPPVKFNSYNDKFPYDITLPINDGASLLVSVTSQNSVTLKIKNSTRPYSLTAVYDEI